VGEGAKAEAVTALVVPALRWVTVCVILDLSHPVARTRGPASLLRIEWTFAALPASIKAELTRAKEARVILPPDNRRHVTLTRADAATLADWCAAAAETLLAQEPPNRLDALRMQETASELRAALGG